MTDTPHHTVGNSKSYKLFVGAYTKLANNLLNRWTMEDFAACFPSYCADAPEQAAELRARIGQVMAAYMLEHAQRFLDIHDAGPAIDTLHAAAAAAREHDRSDPPPKDGWRPEIEPRTVVRARVMPLLKQERERRMKLLRELEQENEQLAERIEAAAAAKADADAQLTARLDALAAAINKWSAIPVSDLEEWTYNALQERPKFTGRAADQRVSSDPPQPVTASQTGSASMFAS